MRARKRKANKIKAETLGSKRENKEKKNKIYTELIQQWSSFYGVSSCRSNRNTNTEAPNLLKTPRHSLKRQKLQHPKKINLFHFQISSWRSKKRWEENKQNKNYEGKEVAFLYFLFLLLVFGRVDKLGFVVFVNTLDCCKTRTAFLYWRRWWEQPQHRKARKARGLSSKVRSFA